MNLIEMTENQVVYLGSSLCLLLIFMTFKVNVKFALINLISFIFFSSIFYYGLFYDKEGSSLGSLILLMLTTAIQIIVIIMFFLINYFRKRSASS